MAEEILLSVGISLESLKAAKSKIETELKTWKTPEAGIIDEKAIRGAARAAKSYLKEVGDAGKKIASPEVAVRASEAFKKIEDDASSSEAQLAKLTQTTAYYASKNKIMGTSLSSVSSELNTYLRIEAQGVVLDATSAKRKEELIVLHQKLAKEQQGLMHGVNLPRLLIWAVGWTALYRIMNIVGETISGIIQNIIQLNEVIDRARIVHGEMGKVFDDTYSNVRKSIYSAAIGSRIAAKDIAQAFQTITYEGANLSTTIESLAHVRDLMIITGEKEKPIATALIETYGLFGDKLSGAIGESEKLAKITDLLTAVFTKAHISLSEYQQIMSYIAPTAAEAVESYEFLVRLLIFADKQMLQGRRAAMALTETLIGLVDNSAKLAEVFGIVFKPGEEITVEEVLRRISEVIKDLNEQARKDLLGKIFKGSSLRVALELFKQEDLTLKSLTDDVDGLGKSMAKAADRAHYLGIAFKSSFEDIASFISSTWEKLNGFLYDLNKVTEQYEFKRALESVNYRGPFGIRPEPIFRNRLIESGRMREADFTRNLMATRTAEEELPKQRTKIFTQEEIKAAITITQETKKQLAVIQREAELRILESSGVSAMSLQQQKTTNAIEKATGLIENEEQRRAAIADLMRNSGKDVETLYKIAMSHVTNEVIAQEYINELIEARYEIYQKIAEEIKSLADELESVAVDFVKKLTAGTLDIKGFLSGIMDAYKTAFAENIVKIFGEKTGIFANMATTFMNPIQKAHYTGIKDAVPQIIKAHIDGITQGMAGVGSGQTTGQQSGGSSGGLLQNIAGMLGGGSSNQYGVTGGKIGPATQSQATMQKIGKAGGQLIAVASFASEMASAYKYKGTGNPWGAAMSLGTSGAMAGMAVGGPIGAVIGGVVGATMGFVKGAQSKTTSETAQQIIETNSILKLSQKELQIVNRNLEGIRRGFEGFWHTRSEYFSERRGIEERFSLDSQRGML